MPDEKVKNGSDGSAWCGAIKCKNSKQKRPDLSFHRFPVDPVRSQLWVESTGRKDLIGVTPVYLSENVRICSEHFESYFYHPGSCRLRAGAVPTLFGESAGRRSQRAAFIHLLTLREEQTPKRPELGSDLNTAKVRLTNGSADTKEADKENEEHAPPEPKPNSLKASSTPAPDKVCAEAPRRRRAGQGRRHHGGSWCGAPRCRAHKDAYPQLSFHRFPRNPERSKIWIEKTGRDDLKGKSAEYLSLNIFLCSRHFERTQYFPSKKQLLRNAVPTIFDLPPVPDSLELQEQQRWASAKPTAVDGVDAIKMESDETVPPGEASPQSGDDRQRVHQTSDFGVHQTSDSERDPLIKLEPLDSCLDEADPLPELSLPAEWPGPRLATDAPEAQSVAKAAPPQQAQGEAAAAPWRYSGDDPAENDRVGVDVYGAAERASESRAKVIASDEVIPNGTAASLARVMETCSGRRASAIFKHRLWRQYVNRTAGGETSDQSADRPHPAAGPDPNPGNQPSGDRTGLVKVHMVELRKHLAQQHSKHLNYQKQLVSYKKQVNRLRCKVRRQSRRLEEFREREKLPPEITAEHVLAFLQRSLPRTIFDFVKLQLESASRESQGRRYSDEELMNCLALYQQSSKAYELLKARFFLPSTRILRRMKELNTKVDTIILPF